jgi:hypothetical protein
MYPDTPSQKQTGPGREARRKAAIELIDLAHR